MDKVMPKCPGCGYEMTLWIDDGPAYHTGGMCEYSYRCTECGWLSPRRNSDADACAAAMHRWQEPNRVLTLEELDKADSERSLYFETREPWSGGEVFESSVECAQETFCDGDESNDARKEYGVTVRCWLRRPTDAEREAVRWEDAKAER